MGAILGNNFRESLAKEKRISYSIKKPHTQSHTLS
jgi:hypothetical protein